MHVFGWPRSSQRRMQSTDEEVVFPEMAEYTLDLLPCCLGEGVLEGHLEIRVGDKVARQFKDLAHNQGRPQGDSPIILLSIDISKGQNSTLPNQVRRLIETDVELYY